MPPSLQKKMSLEQRRKIVAANILAGATYRDLSERLGVSIGTIARDVQIIRQRWQKETLQDTEGVVQLELRRLEIALNAIWDKVRGGDFAAIQIMIRIMERKAKLLGLDAPTKVDVDWRAELRELGVEGGEVFEELVNNITSLLQRGDGEDDSRGREDGPPAGGTTPP